MMEQLRGWLQLFKTTFEQECRGFKGGRQYKKEFVNSEKLL